MGIYWIGSLPEQIWELPYIQEVVLKNARVSITFPAQPSPSLRKMFVLLRCFHFCVCCVLLLTYFVLTRRCISALWMEQTSRRPCLIPYPGATSILRTLIQTHTHVSSIFLVAFANIYCSGLWYSAVEGTRLQCPLPAGLVQRLRTYPTFKWYGSLFLILQSNQILTPFIRLLARL